MTEGPKFEPPFEGNCEVLKCVRHAEYRALWPNVIKLVCKPHKDQITDKPWPEVAELFGSIPPK